MMARRAVLSVAERARSFVQSSESEDGPLMTKSPVDEDKIECLGPIVEREVLLGDAQGTRPAKEGPAGSWDSGGDHAEGGAAGGGLNSTGSRHG